MAASDLGFAVQWFSRTLVQSYSVAGTHSFAEVACGESCGLSLFHIVWSWQLSSGAVSLLQWTSCLPNNSTGKGILSSFFGFNLSLVG